jgi:23S rRNA (cytosine1962-C5)-methyltransferase
MEYPRVTLKPKEEGRLQKGHLWAFSNEVATAPAGLPPGALSDLYSNAGFGARNAEEGSSLKENLLPDSASRVPNFVGRGFYHPHSLIAFRVLSDQKEDIDKPFFKKRLTDARELRERFYPGSTAYRWVYGESDRLPGLVVDRFGDYLVVQALSAGMEIFKDMIVELLNEIARPKGIVWRSDAPVRALEGLKEEAPQAIAGSVPPRVEIATENGKFYVDLLGGQKTGFYFDQRDNRQALAPLCAGKRVLDAFCYSGGFGIAALRAGARDVVFVDSSHAALELAEANAHLNGVAERCTFVEGDALQLIGHENPGGPFDVICVDPPAYARSKKHLIPAIKAYEKLNALAIEALPGGGILASSSCSHFVDRGTFRDIQRKAAFKARRSLRLLEFRSQSKDHPVLLAMPETEYLKFTICQVL